ncbi:MAG: 30S ribosomal protein S9 [Patescibacteria group bacterium]
MPKQPTKQKTIKKQEAHLKYFEAVGRRKTAVARVRLYTKGISGIMVNSKDHHDYFPGEAMPRTVLEALAAVHMDGKLGVTAQVSGGGIHAQSTAVQLGIARALLQFNKDYRGRLRDKNLLTRDAREKERRKFGLKKARKAPQWAKR